MYAELNALPESVRQALASVGYRKTMVEVVAREQTSLQSSACSTGTRGWTVVVNLSTGEYRSLHGSWGGANPFEHKVVDHSDERFDIPADCAVLKDNTGPGFCDVIVHPNTLNRLSLPAADELPALDKAVLDVVVGIKAFAREREYEYRKIPLTDVPAAVERLVSGGYLARNKAGALAATVKGRNARKGNHNG